MFARSNAAVREKLQAIEGRVRAAYIDEETHFESGLPLNSYYPLLEIVTVALAQTLDPRDAAEISAILEKTRVQYEEKNGTPFYIILPTIQRHNTEQELVKRYAALKEFLRAA